MFEVKANSGEKVDSSTSPDEGAEAQGPGPPWFSLHGSEHQAPYLSDGRDVVAPTSGSNEEDDVISPVLAEETLHYMVLTADRVDPTTRTYNDITMVTHLLAERDRDLELAARIGQSLLQRNHLLQERNEVIDEQLAKTMDQVRQLQHELMKKDKLLRMVASASEESEAEPSCSPPPSYRLPSGATLVLNQLEVLQNKMQELEEENTTLRAKACRLKTETLTYEEKEQELVRDCVRELRDCNRQMMALTDELSQRNEELLRHQEEIAQLLSQIVELQHRVKELALEKEELRTHLQASKDAQRHLTAELNELQDQNSECTAMLQESQEEIRELRSKNLPSAGLQAHLPYGLFPLNSLAAEIEGSMQREQSEEDDASQELRASQRRVFQAVKSINRLVLGHRVPPPIPGSARGGVVMTAQPFPSMQAGGANKSSPCDRKQAPPGKPGSLGAGDLLAALRRLALRRQNLACERRFFQAQRDGKLHIPVGDTLVASVGSCNSPGSSTASFASDFSDLTSGGLKTFLPEKLQIVKPMEGSLTLHHWQQLAQPHLASILDPPPGVVTKGFRPLPQDAVYRLTDLEEDDEEEQIAGRVPGRWREVGTGRSKPEEEEDEEEGEGITFVVPCASTPEEKMERRTSRSLNALPSSLPTTLSTPSAAQQCRTQVISSYTHPSAHHPGKCLSSTCSTYTFTTCRILHPSDTTQVTPSSLSRPLAAVSGNIPSSMRTGPSTPVTPCRLSLADSCVPPAAPCGLAKILQEKGISAQVIPVPATPPSSPVPFEPTSSDSFLASRPAELFLQDVYGLKLGRMQPDPPPRDQGQVMVGLADRLQQLGFMKAMQGGLVRDPGTAAPCAPAGSNFLDRLRRNHSFPAAIGGWSLPLSSPLHQVTPPQPLGHAPTDPNPVLQSHKKPVSGQPQAQH